MAQKPPSASHSTGLGFALLPYRRGTARLRLAPPEGLPAREYLGSFPGWEGALTLVRQVSQGSSPAPAAAAAFRSCWYPQSASRGPPPRQSFSELGRPQLILDDLKLAETVVSLGGLRSS